MGLKRRILSIALAIVMIISGVWIFPEEMKAADDVTVSYCTHVQRLGWQDWRQNGAMAGTEGQSLRLEGIRIRLNKSVTELGIQYTTHCQSYGWLPWSANGEMNGTEGEAKRLEAIKIRLTGSQADRYDVYYRVHAQNYGWMNWAKNGEAAGTAGMALRLEGIQVLVLEKGVVPSAEMSGITNRVAEAYAYNTGDAVVDVPGENKTNILYRTHVQKDGWQGWKYNGVMAGTQGRSLRLEGIYVALSNQQYSGGLMYRTHVQRIGWQDWKNAGEMSGTSGQALRLEAIQIFLTGDMASHYDVYYRVHAQAFGWLGWVKNGEPSGTAGFAKRLEGIQIILVEKNGVVPGEIEGVISAREEGFVKTDNSETPENPYTEMPISVVPNSEYENPSDGGNPSGAVTPDSTDGNASGGSAQGGTDSGQSTETPEHEHVWSTFDGPDTELYEGKYHVQETILHQYYAGYYRLDFFPDLGYGPDLFTSGGDCTGPDFRIYDELGYYKGTRYRRCDVCGKVEEVGEFYEVIGDFLPLGELVFPQGPTDERWANVKTTELSESTKKGDIITFGKYEQDNNLTNGKEPIEWIVLDKAADGSLFVVSRYILDSVDYYSGTWSNSRVRAYLNNEFIGDSFSDDEKNKIKETLVKADGPVFRGESSCDREETDTIDKVFLLSSKEVDQYFETSHDCIAEWPEDPNGKFYTFYSKERAAKPTPYAVQKKLGYDTDGHGVDTSIACDAVKNYFKAFDGCEIWMLRTGGAVHWIGGDRYEKWNQSFVTVFGALDETGEGRYIHFGLRPAMWIKPD